jgi:hypothetical protein
MAGIWIGLVAVTASTSIGRNLDWLRFPEPGDDLGAGTYNSVLKQAGLKK